MKIQLLAARQKAGLAISKQKCKFNKHVCVYKLIKKNCCNLAVNYKIVLQAELRAEATYLHYFLTV